MVEIPPFCTIIALRFAIDKPFLAKLLMVCLYLRSFSNCLPNRILPRKMLCTTSVIALTTSASLNARLMKNSLRILFNFECLHIAQSSLCCLMIRSILQNLVKLSFFFVLFINDWRVFFRKNVCPKTNFTRCLLTQINK